MARKNYSKMSKKPEIKEEVAMTDSTPVVDESATPDPEAAPPVIGVVAKCGKLNIRMKPSSSAEILCEVALNSELTIDIDKSNEKWLKVCTAAGIEGFCMRNFVEIRQ